MKSFDEFMYARNRENKDRLDILLHILKKAGFKVKNHLNEDKDPYIFVYNPREMDRILENLTFEGIRIYTRGKDNICYRVANRDDTEPYGTTYLLDVKGMFKSLIKEVKKDKLGLEIIKYIIDELKNFFLNSAKAEQEGDEDNMPSGLGSVVDNSSGTGTDYANQVFANVGRT